MTQNHTWWAEDEWVLLIPGVGWWFPSKQSHWTHQWLGIHWRLWTSTGPTVLSFKTRFAVYQLPRPPLPLGTLGIVSLLIYEKMIVMSVSDIHSYVAKYNIHPRPSVPRGGMGATPHSRFDLNIKNIERSWWKHAARLQNPATHWCLPATISFHSPMQTKMWACGIGRPVLPFCRRMIVCFDIRWKKLVPKMLITSQRIFFVAPLPYGLGHGSV